MEDVENVSYRETMVKFHASSIAPAIKVMLEKTRILTCHVTMKLSIKLH